MRQTSVDTDTHGTNGNVAQMALCRFTLPDSVRKTRRKDVVVLLRLAAGVNAMESTLRLLIRHGDDDGTPAAELARVHSVFAAISYLREIVKTVEKEKFEGRLWALVDVAVQNGADIGMDMGEARLLLSPAHPQIGGDVLLKVRDKVGFHWDPQPFEAFLDDPETATVTIFEGEGHLILDRVFKSSADAMARWLGEIGGDNLNALLERCVVAHGAAGRVVEAAFIGLIMESGEDPADFWFDESTN